MHPNDYNCPFHGLFMNVSTQIIACCAYRFCYLRFPYPFRPRAESATFLFATMDLLSKGSPQWGEIVEKKGTLVADGWTSCRRLLQVVEKCSPGKRILKGFVCSTFQSLLLGS